MHNMKNISRFSFRLLLIVVLSTFATTVASAKTISTTSSTVDTSTLEYFENIYKRSNYKNYVIASEYVQNGGISSYTTYYYLCLSNERINTYDPINVNASCDVLYRSYRYSSTYYLEKLSDNTLRVNNNIYYTNNIYDTDYANTKLLVLLNIGILTFYLSYVILKIFRS